MKTGKKLYERVEELVPIDDSGDYFVQEFYNRYAALRMTKNMPIFDRAYKLLTEREHFSRKNAFGEMHCDGYLWIEQHPRIKVIVEERQSYKHIYIKDGISFHIRALDFHLNYPSYRKSELKGITVDKFRQQGFSPRVPRKAEDQRFDAFTYGDARDRGYLVSTQLWGYREADEEILPIKKSELTVEMKKAIEAFNSLKAMSSIDNSNARTIHAIGGLKYWEYYLDNPDELE